MGGMPLIGTRTIPCIHAATPSTAELAALIFAEAMTRLSDRPDPVSDEVWTEVSKHFCETELAALVLEVATVNLWNRVNAATPQAAA